MGGLSVRRVFAIGTSQSATRLVTYHNSLHPVAGVFDAFLVNQAGGQLRTDLTVKVFKLLTESEITGSSNDQVPLRQPDSDHFRRWEIAGAAHLDFHTMQELAPLAIRDLGQSPPPGCDLPPYSRIPAYVVANAVYDHLVRWVTENVAPPNAPEIQLRAPGPPAVVARDSFGNALGGIRLSQHAVPTATNTGVNSGSFASCKNFGSYKPFDNMTLQGLYPDHTTYVIQVIQATLDTLKAGFIGPEDAAATISDATQADITGVAAPAINTGGVVNAATYTGGPLAPNTIISIFGTNLATATGLGQPTATGYPTTLFGTTVTFGQLVAVPLVYVSPSQINAIVPASMKPGNSDVTVTVYGSASRAEPVTIAPK
jgi:Alpha/beta hydrolase domain